MADRIAPVADPEPRDQDRDEARIFEPCHRLRRVLDELAVFAGQELEHEVRPADVGVVADRLKQRDARAPSCIALQSEQRLNGWSLVRRWAVAARLETKGGMRADRRARI